MTLKHSSTFLTFYDLQSSFDGLDGLDTLSSGGMSSVTNND